MNIRDEIDAMLDNLKTGGVKPAPPSVTAAPKNINPSAPKTVKQPKTIYDDMSVDELLNSLTVQAKAKSEEAAMRLSESKAEEKKTPIADYAEKLVAAPAPSLKAERAVKKESEAAQNNRRSAVASIKAAMEQADEPSVSENEPAVSDIIQEEAGYIADEVNAEPSYDHIAEEPATKEELSSDTYVDEDYAEETYAEEEYSEGNSDKEDYSTEAEEEIVADEPKTKKKGLFSGLKSLFSKKSVTEDDKIADSFENEMSEENEADVEISEEFIAEPDYPAEEPEEELLSEEELLEQLDDELPEEVNDYIPESSDEPVQDLFDEDTTKTENSLPDETDDSAPEDTQESATGLIDAAIAAIEELNLDSEENESSDLSDAQSETDDNREDAADELISDIREDAAEVIAEITGEKSDDTAVDSEETAEESAKETEYSDSENNVDIDINVETPKKKSRIIAVLENILEENPDVISDERSEKAEADSIDISLEKKGSGRLKKYLYTICGVFFAVFTVVGIIASVGFISSRFKSFTAGENKKDSFTDIIYPAVIMDIESFASPSELSSQQIISASLWSLIMSEEKMSKYQQTFDIISVPAVDVEAYATELFGKNLPEISHSTVGSGELKFYYNSETKSYNVPVNPISFTYEPVITSVSKTDNKYTLVVDYIKELPAWIEDKEGYTPDVSKTVEFVLNEKDGVYTIASMTLLNVNVTL